MWEAVTCISVCKGMHEHLCTHVCAPHISHSSIMELGADLRGPHPRVHKQVPKLSQSWERGVWTPRTSHAPWGLVSTLGTAGC